MKKQTMRMMAAAAAAIAICSAGAARASEGRGVAPDAAVKALVDGNARFSAGQPTHPNAGKDRIAETAGGQHPFVAVLGCADSRVSPEILFDQGVGDIFTVRVAGNVSDTDEIGSLEYAVEHLGISAILVLGHTKCGAVTAVVKKAEVGGSLPGLLDNIKPAARTAAHDNPKLTGDDLIPKAIRANVWQSIEDLFKRSEVIRDAVREGKLNVVGGLYDISTGGVEFMGKHDEEKSLVGKAKMKSKAKKHGH